MLFWRNGAMRFLAVLMLFLPTLAVTQPIEVEVDVELVLAVDVSRSMSLQELEIQRRGYAKALSSPEVISAIQQGLLGRIAVTYVEWAGAYSQRVIVPWTLIATKDSAQRVARQIAATKDPGLRRTSIANGLTYAAAQFDDNGFAGLRRVIDVSGDGPNNQGPPVLPARDAVLAQGITINGLPLMTTDALSAMWGIPDLDDYYLNCVIGGLGAFVLPVLSWDQFAPAVKRKLILEIAQGEVRAMPVQYNKPAPYDCLIGEKMWNQNRAFFDIP